MDLSIIYINYNSHQYTLNSIESLKKVIHENITHEIIVIDNHSLLNDYSALEKKLHKNHPDVLLKRSCFNSGFASGNMYGSQHATGKYLLFINNDTLFYQDCFTPLFNYMEKNKQVGVSTVKVFDKEKNLGCSFDHFIGLRKHFLGRTILEKYFKKPKRKNNPYKNPIEVDAVQGCFMFFRAQSFAHIGGFDTNIFLYYEEIDICKRLKNKGYKSIFHPNSSFTHFEGGSSTQLGYLKKLELTISYLYVLRKNFGFLRYFFIKTALIVKYFFKSIFKWNYWKLFFTLLTLGSPLAHSLRQKQSISYIHTYENN
ncbi:MAG: glycosyltransferase family 2 protein [Flavobacteriales bacterium]